MTTEGLVCRVFTAHRSRKAPQPPLQTDVILLANYSQHCWIVKVASVCTPCCLLSRVVESCCTMFETGKTFSYVKTAQHCWPTMLGVVGQRMLRPFTRGVMRIISHYLLQSSQHGYLC